MEQLYSNFLLSSVRITNELLREWRLNPAWRTRFQAKNPVLVLNITSPASGTILTLDFLLSISPAFRVLEAVRSLALGTSGFHSLLQCRRSTSLASRLYPFQKTSKHFFQRIHALSVAFIKAASKIITGPKMVYIYFSRVKIQRRGLGCVSLALSHGSEDLLYRALLTPTSSLVGYKCPRLLLERRIGGNSSWGVQCLRRFRDGIHTTAPNLESSDGEKVEDTINWHFSSQRLVSHLPQHGMQ